MQWPTYVWAGGEDGKPLQGCNPAKSPADTESTNTDAFEESTKIPSPRQNSGEISTEIVSPSYSTRQLPEKLISTCNSGDA